MLSNTLTENGDIANALNWLSKEMDGRYALMMAKGTRSLDEYNNLSHTKLSYILVIVDELADLLLNTDDKSIERNLVRIAQKARACGIHLILATQRPSSDVLTGLLKSNCPSRLAYRVSNAIDSRIILDQRGAEKLNGKGDSLFLETGKEFPIRIQSNYVDDDYIKESVNIANVNSGQVNQYGRMFFGYIKPIDKSKLKRVIQTKDPIDKWLNRALWASFGLFIWSLYRFSKSVFKMLTRPVKSGR